MFSSLLEEGADSVTIATAGNVTTLTPNNEIPVTDEVTVDDDDYDDYDDYDDEE